MFSNTEEILSQPGFFITNPQKFVRRCKCAQVYLYKWSRYRAGKSIFKDLLQE
jgi:hypothetical protein